ncbi:hypothetical protein KAFR_0C04850 [Kazachstania africana CBS 2517]|uniref:Pre-rRNA-processing protein ESF2 n=1 Tax=Kazachstania africana (strain ATCC 22294 / BCRC 22015 / CBS 2517 / CECT 1963 / NBRC 1671 / NRRL Y-8276) TaxID=1071382 RepID=H2ASX6_KAZAF|nr:hypothetical protein KAFR_0C04850 [Kazachstania africana CBS 2517]CCF57476.1 hypothetical protein KAFR_0C04850 [Kazachstania africana CBS 2517]
MSSIKEDYNDFSSDEEENNNPLFTSKKKVNIEKDLLSNESDHEDDNDEKENDDLDKIKSSKEEILKGKNDEMEEGTEDKINDEAKEESTSAAEDKAAKLKKRLEFVNALKNSKHKTGVIYFSSIPPYMKPAKMRQILSRFGLVDRLFLKREDEKKYKQRIRGGGNKKTMYEEGWAEFVRKRDAKLCAETLNGNIIGGKKGTFYHDDILNVKYLPGFKWADLTEQIARENDVRQAKLEMEISQANKLNAEFIRNVEKSKMVENIRKSKKRSAAAAAAESSNGDAEDSNYQRNFKQHKVSTSRADAPDTIKQKDSSKIGNILSSLL